MVVVVGVKVGEVVMMVAGIDVLDNFIANGGCCME